MRVDILAKVLESADAGIRGITIFAHHMPAECTQGLLIKLPLTGINNDHNLPNYFTGRVQVIVRAETQLPGDVLCQKVIDALHSSVVRKFYDPVLPNMPVMQINQMLSEHLPIQFPRLEGGGIEWSLNFLVSYVMFK